MATILDKQALPTSVAGAKSFGKNAVSIATTGLVIVAGLGLLGLALPWVRKVPVLGSVFGASSIGQSAAVDAFGTVA